MSQRSKRRVCMSCRKKAERCVSREEKVKRRTCSDCHKEKADAEYEPTQWKDGKRRVCMSCQEKAERRECSVCSEDKIEKKYQPKEWNEGKRRICKECASSGKVRVKKQWGQYTCGKCSKLKPRKDFTRCHESYIGKKRGRCDGCFEDQERDEKRASSDSTSMVQKSES